VAALLRPQQVAGAADLQVAGGDAEAGAQVAELADRQQAPARPLGEHGVRRHQQVAVGELVAAPDPAAELVELSQPEAVGAVDDHRVDVGDVDAVLDDRGGQQQVELAAVKACMRFESSASSSWPWPTVTRRPGTSSRRKEATSSIVLDPVVHVVDLPAALELGLDRLAHQLLGRRGQAGLHRHAVACGGVSMTDRSRTPASDSCRVRGTGVADIASTWTFFAAP
jgi:hypothetical protein